MAFCKIVNKASYSRYSQRWQVLHAIPSKCPSDMTLLNEPLSETPLGALFVKTHISVIAAEAFKVYLKSTTYKFQLCRYIWKVATQMRIMGHDWLHCEQRAKLRKEKQAAKEQVLWFRWSWQALGHRREIQPFQTGVKTPAKVLNHIISTVDQHWVTRTLHFYLIIIKGSLSHVKAALKISQCGNKVMDEEAILEATGIPCEVMCIKAAALQGNVCTSTVPGVVTHYLQVLTVEYKAAWKIS